jgi:hypothetical protein
MARPESIYLARKPKWNGHERTQSAQKMALNFVVPGIFKGQRFSTAACQILCFLRSLAANFGVQLQKPAVSPPANKWLRSKEKPIRPTPTTQIKKWIHA